MVALPVDFKQMQVKLPHDAVTLAPSLFELSCRIVDEACLVDLFGFSTTRSGQSL